MPLLTVEIVRECFRYDDGKLYWLDRPCEHFATDASFRAWNTKYAHTEAGYDHVYLSSGDIRWIVTIFGKPILRSVLVWALHHGCFPDSELDHEDRDSTNDHIENLRPANNSQNGANRTKGVNNTTGRKGVSWHFATGLYQANIRVNGRLIPLGLFSTVESAHQEYCKAAEKYFGKFACPG